MLAGILRHLSGRRSPAEISATFVRLAALFAVCGLAVGLTFRYFGFSMSDPGDDQGRALIAVALGALALVGVWFMAGSLRVLMRRHGPGGGRDSIIVMLAISLASNVWSIQGVVKLAQGAPVYIAVAWNPRAAPWNEVVLRGEEIVAQGEISPSFAQKLERALDDAPDAEILRITSGGGLTRAAGIMARQVENRGMAVVVDRFCASACLDVFLAGDERVLARGARLGCHQASDALTGRSVGPSNSFLPLLDRAEREPAIRDKVFSDARRQVYSPTFARIVRQCDATPPEEIHFPSLSELVAIGAVTRVGDTFAASRDAEQYCSSRPRDCN